MDERQGRRVTGSGCEDEQKKGCKGGGSHCHANWWPVQTSVSCKGILKGKVRYERLRHHLLSAARVLSSL